VSDFKFQALRELTDQQVRFAPPARRQEQVVRAERLLGEIDPGKQYPYQFVCYRITDYRSDAYPDLLIPGGDLRAELALFVKKVERSIPAVPIEQALEPMLGLDEVSKQLSVSTKTISRWRVKGLVGQRVLRNGRRMLAFPKSMVDQFIVAHQESVSRGASFSHLSDGEREDILRRAKRLSLAGGSLTEVSRRIARKLHRSAEAVRYTIKNFDRDHPDQALFPSVIGPLDGDQKQTIYNSYRKGVKVDTLARQFGRTRTSMYRVINEVRAEKLIQQPLDYIYNVSFDDPAKEDEILAPMPDAAKFEAQRRSMRVPKYVPPELAALYEWPLLTKDQEQHTFRQMNYLKHQLHQLRQRLGNDPSRARVQDFQAVDDLQEKISSVKDLLINCNMRLVVSIAKRHSAQTENIWELLSDGNMSLIRAVEKFDYSRGFKFSTYASWAIMKNFARSIPDEKHHRERYLTGHEELFEAAPDTRSDESEIMASAEHARDMAHQFLNRLSPRDREIIRLRAGIDNSEGMTLEEIGQRLGITKERVRQLHVRAMRQLREMATEQKIDMP